VGPLFAAASQADVMKLLTLTHPVWLRVLAAVGILFGLLTLREGGAVLLGDAAARTAVGNYVPFVVWFNFLAGFAYIIAGAGLAFRQAWAVRMALIIALATLSVFAAFGVHVATGGAFETRTVFAMTLRSVVWLVVAAIGWPILREGSKQPAVLTE